VNDPIASGFWFAEIEHGGMVARGAARPAQARFSMKSSVKKPYRRIARHRELI